MLGYHRENRKKGNMIPGRRENSYQIKARDILHRIVEYSKIFSPTHTHTHTRSCSQILKPKNSNTAGAETLLQGL